MQETLELYIYQKHTVAAIRTSERAVHKSTMARVQQEWDSRCEEACEKLCLPNGALAADL